MQTCEIEDPGNASVPIKVNSSECRVEVCYRLEEKDGALSIPPKDYRIMEQPVCNYGETLLVSSFN